MLKAVEPLLFHVGFGREGVCLDGVFEVVFFELL